MQQTQYKKELIKGISEIQRTGVIPDAGISTN